MFPEKKKSACEAIFIAFFCHKHFSKRFSNISMICTFSLIRLSIYVSGNFQPTEFLVVLLAVFLLIL